ncbi:sensor histidine kinase [Quisquiliibacterium transsilvanicum]|uniref:histidine kinase n=1 Tax=Quisquiliibacterium transsilvanicum TaxID=1549638 RepID=A0A7W8M9P1_9BURK|nr:ATP-binding protein [Quisquiliibacterium transsilvanicum]MBB5272832.1 nitrogen fixation/metabolism regulation signal transduction histidine kinase [Quisquiliibacterium transsilvanicum]
MDPIPIRALDLGKRAVTRALRVSLIVSVALAAILLALLATASGNTQLFERHYPTLLWITLGVAGTLLVLVLELLRRLAVRWRRGLFGTRLMARMAGAFVLMSVLPVALVFLVAVQFVGRSIESWFDVPLERALDSGLSLARASLESQLSDLTQKARVMAAELAESPPGALSSTLSGLRDQAGVQEALVLSGSGRIVVASGGRFAQLVPDLPPSDVLRQARLTRQFARIEGGDPGDPQGVADAAGAGGISEALKLRVIVAIVTEGQLADDSRYLQLVQPVPTALSQNAEAVQQGYRDFQELSLARAGLKRVFRITLTLIFLLTVFSAVAGAFLLAGWLTGPLSELAAATRAVAEGDFRQVKDYAGRDELGVLTGSFNAMTRQLQEARLLVERNQRELERVNARLESVLGNIDAGVMVLDSELRLTLANPGADRIVGTPLAAFFGQPLAALPRLGELEPEVRSAFNEQAATGAGSWQRQFALQRPVVAEDSAGAVPARTEQTLLARGSILPERRVGYVIVFDDISEVISAQRAVAWSEVARRLAHEITNPLTPIQLAAERMQLKLHGKLAGADAELLQKNSQTIVNQVAALKMMVDEFRDYARLPAARLTPIALNELIDDVLRLYSAPEAHGAIQLQLAEALPRVMGDATQLRQVIHNLLKNALEAAERRERPEIRVSTEAIALPDDALAVRLMVRDNGTGFTPALLARAFEPYVTSKPRGTGLGLPIVRKIIEEHQARIEVANWNAADGTVGGAQVSVLFTKLAKSGENPRFDPAERRQDEGHG